MATDADVAEREDSFRSVLGIIRECHSLGESAAVPSVRCKTSLGTVFGLQAESSSVPQLPLSPLLKALLDDVNLAYTKFGEDQTVRGFLPIPQRRHRRYYQTSPASFPTPYLVSPVMASLLMEKASEVKKRAVSISHSQVSSLETNLSSVCEATSWLDWWLSTCGSFRDHLSGEVRADFERLMISGSRALEFLGGQGITALGNLVLSRRDSLLQDVRSTVPVEEVARLRHSPLPVSSALFPSPLLEGALVKMRASANDQLVQKTLFPPRIPRRPASDQAKAPSNSGSVLEDRPGSSQTGGRSYRHGQGSSSSSSSYRGGRGGSRKGGRPFSRSSSRSGKSGGKGRGSGKKQA